MFPPFPPWLALLFVVQTCQCKDADKNKFFSQTVQKSCFAGGNFNWIRFGGGAFGPAALPFLSERPSSRPCPQSVTTAASLTASQAFADPGLRGGTVPTQTEV